MGTEVLYRGKEAGAWCWPFTSIQRRGSQWRHIYTPTPPVCHHGVDKDNFTFFYLLLYRSSEYKHEARRRSTGSLHVSLILNEKAFLQWSSCFGLYTAMTQFDANVFLEKCYNPGKRSLKRSWQKFILRSSPYRDFTIWKTCSTNYGSSHEGHWCQRFHEI